MSLPAWAQVSPERRAHIERVIGLLNSWADAMHVDAKERDRWLRAGWLHDALRDAPFPDALAHGPAAADRAAAKACSRCRRILAEAWPKLPDATASMMATCSRHQSWTRRLFA